MIDILIPDDLWDGDREAAISVWLYAEGDNVSAGAAIAEVMVEKTSYEILAPASGRLAILIAVDEVVLAGQTIGQIG